MPSEDAPASGCCPLYHEAVELIGRRWTGAILAVLPRAEVAARFTLDAMPGKQMAIDADLNAGVINEQEARKRRANVAQEADFYGAMDGASKFVRGDAIAQIVIIVVNILGGFAGQVNLEHALANAPAGLLVADAAGLMFETAEPSRNEIEKARRRLNALISNERAVREDEPDGTVRYFARARTA